ncbi:LOW QUALITY PROTEIN: 40S ribosomal protein S23-like [Homalodisca vitripennis]|uniref:LOW QUALITY PROTEIN: 40S ribosomal protein S23-like n=1 Tax=Homalodisca vitripennis TaxID=197043 RepID=UPI001EEBF32C|nr:LOW QUALITY PROTEIN: 40S ribosomal protein S23-like [Homalodisca vitripennis]
MRGLFAACTLRKKSQLKRRHDGAYRRRQLGKVANNVMGGKPQAKGIVLAKIGVEAKQPNSAIRKVCRIQVIATGKNLLAFAPGDGALKVIEENDEVCVEGLGKKGRAVGDMPGIKYKITKVSGVSLPAILNGTREKPNK